MDLCSGTVGRQLNHVWAPDSSLPKVDQERLPKLVEFDLSPNRGDPAL
jgi:hypothetical protein